VLKGEVDDASICIQSGVDQHTHEADLTAPSHWRRLTLCKQYSEVTYCLYARIVWRKGEDLGAGKPKKKVTLSGLLWRSVAKFTATLGLLGS
jgi:hypothetical protein